MTNPEGQVHSSWSSVKVTRYVSKVAWIIQIKCCNYCVMQLWKILQEEEEQQQYYPILGPLRYAYRGQKGIWLDKTFIFWSENCFKFELRFSVCLNRKTYAVFFNFYKRWRFVHMTSSTGFACLHIWLNQISTNHSGSVGWKKKF